MNSSTFELIFNSNDHHTYSHYNGTCTALDLLLVISDIGDLTKHSVLDDPGSGHRQIIADISFGSTSKQSISSSKTLWNFKKARWSDFTAILKHELHPDCIDFSLHPSRICNLIGNKILACAKWWLPSGRVRKYRCFSSQELDGIKKLRNVID